MGEEEKGGGSVNLLLSFLLGGLIGVGIGVLLAPQRGEETRRKIKKLADDVKDNVGEYTEEIKDKIGSIYEKGKEIVKEKKSLITKAVEAGKEAMEREKSSNKEQEEVL